MTLDMDLGERASHRSSFVPTNSITSDDVAKQGKGGEGVGGGDAKGLLGSGGGWQFLVDVTREEAEEALLAENSVGAFLIRPSKEAPEVFSLSFVAELKDAKGVQVQHAIIRLEEKGFRCGSYGPFAKLWEVRSCDELARLKDTDVLIRTQPYLTPLLLVAGS